MAFDGIPWLHGLSHPRLSGENVLYERRGLALIAVSMGVFLIALDITIVGVTGPMLSKGLGATATEIQWAFDAFTVVLGGFVVLGGGLAERYGRKGFLQIGTAVFCSRSSRFGVCPKPGNSECRSRHLRTGRNRARYLIFGPESVPIEIATCSFRRQKIGQAGWTPEWAAPFEAPL
jgi:hypothetical protein